MAMRIVLFICLFIVCSLGLLWLLPSTQPPAPTVIERNYPVEPPKNNVRNVTPDNALPGPDIAGKLLVRLPGKIQPVREHVVPDTVEYRKLIVPAAGVLNSGDITLHVRGIKPLNLEAICQSENGESWPCGRFARTAMRQLILRRTINCEPAEELNNRLLTKCRIGTRDIGKWLVAQGWAESVDGEYSEQMEAAKQSHRGMWRLGLP
ncbi:MAG: thermonuclease family protein [Hyphomicrobiales bacterium]|nr:thermonuclease family protein [Hyphomicrobiales bacterium]